MATLTVGIGQKYQRIADAVAASRDGDVVAVQAGSYANDFATIIHKITLQGVGGMVKMIATVAPPNGKAILTTDNDATIDHFEFSGAKVADMNGAGIRYEKGNLLVTNSYFHDNENGLLGAADANGTITVRNSEFSHNGNGNGLTHNIYAGVIKQLTIQDSYIHDAVIGHEVKSRALNTVITGSRIQDNSGNASYVVDLPQGGNGLIQGNTIQKGANAPNPVIVAFGEEGGLHPGSSLLVRGNVIVNDDRGGVAVWNATGYAATMDGNKVYGMGAAPGTRGTVGQAGTTTLTSRPALSVASPITGPAQSTLAFNLSEDAGHGDAQAYIRVDGQQLGGLQTITASHALGQAQRLSFIVALAAGPHTASVLFINHASDATGAGARNLYVESLDLGAQHVAAAATLNRNGTANFVLPAVSLAVPAAIPAESTLARIVAMLPIR